MYQNPAFPDNVCQKEFWRIQQRVTSLCNWCHSLSKTAVGLSTQKYFSFH